MVEFADASVHDLIRATEFLHHIKPALKTKFVFGIEKALPMDQNVVFHLTDRKVAEGEKRSPDQTETFMLSAQYILEHPYWYQDQPEKS